MSSLALHRAASSPVIHHGLRSAPHGWLPPILRLLATGGDRRIAPDPMTGRNRYGTRFTPADNEISFASTTASNLSVRGLLAAERAYRRLGGDLSNPAIALETWFADLRARIGEVLGCPEAEVILAASGTDAELVALALFAGLSGKPITNILVAPDETGRGVPLAASGSHYSDVSALGHAVQAGASPTTIAAESMRLVPVMPSLPILVRMLTRRPIG